ncbi:MAG: phosphoglycolate phosphatase [Burkholderiaceae bacterium]
MFDLVLFDLDGTLIDTAPEIADAVNALLAGERLPRVDEALVRDGIGHGTRELLRAALAESVRAAAIAPERAPALDALMPAFDRHYLAHCGKRSRVFDAVEPTLDALRHAGVRTAVVTNKEERYAYAVLDAHRLRDYLDLVICGDTLAAKKPDPLPVAHCLHRFNVAAQRALLVGDSEIDVATARAAGIRVWAVPYGYNRGRPIASAGPDRIIDSIAEVARALEGERAAA